VVDLACGRGEDLEILATPPLLIAVGLLSFVVPPAGLLYYVVVPTQWALVGWLVGRLLTRRPRRVSSAAEGT
jgi:hypothetical protein